MPKLPETKRVQAHSVPILIKKENGVSTSIQRKEKSALRIKTDPLITQHEHTQEEQLPDPMATESPTSQTIALNNIKDQSHSIMRDVALEINDKENKSRQNSVPISGEYYGTYDGSDKGSFYFRIDSSGSVFGSGSSQISRSNFLISGKIAADGVIELLGKGMAGTANFRGKIHASTGEVSGTWYLANFGKGTFSGKREDSRVGKMKLNR